MVIVVRRVLLLLLFRRSWRKQRRISRNSRLKSMNRSLNLNAERLRWCKCYGVCRGLGLSHSIITGWLRGARGELKIEREKLALEKEAGRREHSINQSILDNIKARKVREACGVSLLKRCCCCSGGT